MNIDLYLHYTVYYLVETNIQAGSKQDGEEY
jgi:hypothetical protein